MNNEVELAVAIIVTLDWAKDCITLGCREYYKELEREASFNTPPWTGGRLRMLVTQTANNNVGAL
jgi:hypothetical protein